MRTAVSILFVCLVLVALTGCPDPADQPARESSEEPSARADPNTQALLTWLTCSECGESQLEAVLRLDPLPVSELAYAAQNGPTDATMDSFEARLDEVFDDLQEYSKDHPEALPGTGRRQFIEQYASGFKRRYKVRAVQGLGRIKTRAAIGALEDAFCAQPPTGEKPDPAVKAAIRVALGTVPSCPP